MPNKIPDDIIDWNSLSDDEFISKFNALSRADLRLSYLFYNDIPLELFGCTTNLNWIELLTQVFKDNDALGVKPKREELKIWFSLEGIQQQINEVVREQYYEESSFPPIMGGHVFYVRAFKGDDGEIHSKTEKLSLIMDKTHCYYRDLRYKALNSDNATFNATLHLAGDALISNSNGQRVMFDYLSTKLQERYNQIKGSR